MKETVQVFYLIYDSPTNPWVGGGGAARAFEVSRRLSDFGIETTILCGAYPGCPKEQRLAEGCIVRYVGTLRKNYFLSRLAYAFRTRGAIRREPCDIIVDDYSPFTLTFAFLRGRVPVIGLVAMSGMGLVAFSKLSIAGIAPWFYDKLAIRFYRTIIAVSPTIAARLAEVSRAEIITIPNGVSADFFRMEPRDGNYLLYLGRIEIFQKGLDILLQAFSLIRDSFPELRLMIAGSGKDETALAEMIRLAGFENRVTLAGRVSGEKTKEVIASARLVLMPSRFEGWPLVALEAAACGKVVVGTAIPGLSDAVLHDRTGILVPPNDAPSLAKAVKGLLQSPPTLKKLSEEAVTWAMKHTWEEVAAKQAEVYRAAKEKAETRRNFRAPVSVHCLR